MKKTGADEVKKVLLKLNLTEWVWTGSGFASPHKVVVGRSPAASLEPHIFSLPTEMSSYSSFLQKFSCLQQIDARTVVAILATVAADSDGKPLRQPDELKTVVNAITVLAGLINDGELVGEEVFIPDETRVMTKASTL